MKNPIYFFLAFLTLRIILGFSNSNNPKESITSLTNKNESAISVTGNNNNNSISIGLDYFSDDFTAPNDTAALKARGYLVYRNGTFSGNPVPNFWRTGLAGMPAFYGADTDYVGSGWQTAGLLGDIDNCLVLPALEVFALDSICFRSRSTLNSIWPDSIRVMFNPLGGTFTRFS